jgi:RNA recognition motif-containing protein
MRPSAEPPPFVGERHSSRFPELAHAEADAAKLSPDDPSIFIGGLPFSVTESLLSELLTQFGPLAAVRLLKDGVTGRPRGSAFADYFDMRSANYAAAALNGMPLQGRTLRANLARPAAVSTDMHLLQAQQHGHPPNSGDLGGSKRERAIRSRSPPRRGRRSRSPSPHHYDRHSRSPSLPCHRRRCHSRSPSWHRRGWRSHSPSPHRRCWRR